MQKNTFIFFCFVFGIINIHAQNLTHLGFLPRINYTKPINEKISYNGTFFSEIDLADNLLEEVEIPKKVINLTFIGGLAYKLNVNNVLTAGYLFRLIEPFEGKLRLEHRLIQQYVYIHSWGSWRFRNHLRMEQRFIESQTKNGIYNGILRLSYSLGWDVPLQGKHLDQREFYLNSVSSYFVQTTKPRTTFNNLNEFYIGLGYKTKKMGRFEIGPEAKMLVHNTRRNLNTLVFIDLIWYPN